MGFPLTYAQRDHFVISPDMMTDYSDTDVEYMRTFKLEGDAYTANSNRVFDELKPLIIEGPGCTYVKTFGPKRDGRGTILALKRQDEGSATSKQLLRTI